MLFNFRLAPLEKVSLWGRENDLFLSWFGLTDGCYWLCPGDAELFRYNAQLLEKAGGRNAHTGCEAYVDYQVVRLWEDILEILPEVLSPVPRAAAEKLAASNFRAWRAAVERWMLGEPNRLYEPAYEDATEWIRRRHLDSLYLRAGPRIWLWNDGIDIHLAWDNRGLEIDGVPAWTAQLGSWQLSVEAFLAEVRAFDGALMRVMQRRVEQIAAGWTRPGVRIDVDYLVREQADRSTWLEKSLSRAYQRQSQDWRAIIDAIAFIDAETKR